MQTPPLTPLKALAVLSVVLVAAATLSPSRPPGDRLGPLIEEEEEKHARPDQPDEAIRFRMLSLKDEHGRIPANGLMHAATQVRAMRQTQRLEGPGGPTAGLARDEWTWAGPGNIGGRIRTILIHPTTPSTMWIGSVSGGIWKTTNAGGTWAPVDDFMANLAVSTLVMDPTDHDVLYAGTGEGILQGDAIRGAGIFKSVDGGTTWDQVPSTANASFHYVNRLAISPDGSTILAATNSGTYRSINGGTTWLPSFTARTMDVDFHPTDSSRAIAGRTDGQFFSSPDGGVSWSIRVLGGFRVEVAYAASNPEIVYASVEQGAGSLYKSIDGGAHFALVNSTAGYLGGQGWYDNALWVDPTNPEVVIVGGIDLWRSTNGGVTLNRISEWFRAPSSAHADHHVIVAHPGFNGTSNTTVYFGNDGGIYRADQAYTVGTPISTNGWQELNNTLGITQFYGAAASPITGAITGGTQDNGTLFYTTAGGTEGWKAPFGGDGGFSAYDPEDPNYFYGEYIYLRIHRNTTGGAGPSSSIYNGITDTGIPSGEACALFIAPFVLDPSDPNTMLAGGCQLWRSTNVKAPVPTWASIRPTTGWISALAVAAQDSDTIWLAQANGDVFHTANGTAATPAWTRLDAGPTPLPNRMATRIAIDPQNPDVVYVAFGGFTPDNLWKTTDGGASWSDVTGSGGTGLPDAPIRSIAIHPDNSQWLYVGTEVGVFASEDGGATWALPHGGPANVSVDEVFFINTSPRKLAAATHGRGIYTIVAEADTLRALSVGDVSVAEGSAGSRNAVFTVSLSATSSAPVTVDYATEDGTANAPGDYVAKSGTLTFAPGQTSQRITVGVHGDTLDESNETFLLNLTSASNARLGDPQGKATITDDDVGGALQFSLGAYSVAEASPQATITVTRTGGLASGVTVQYRTTNGTAGASDYTGVIGTLAFGAGVASRTFTVPITNDTADESEETVGLILAEPGGGATLGTRATATLTIVDNDTAGVLQFKLANTSVSEAASGATITVTRTGGTASGAAVSFRTEDVTAMAGVDYTAASFILSFGANEKAKSFVIPLLDDSLGDGNKLVRLVLSSPTGGATLGPQAAATLTIQDSESVLQFGTPTFTVSEKGRLARVTVTRSGWKTSAVTVRYATSDGSALAGSDYSPVSGVLSFPANVVTRTFTVPITNDGLSEPTETILLTLSAPGGPSAVLGSLSAATLDIWDND